MTAEICIMNREAVALAADSAMTVRRWVQGKEETRYFKGTNKIFEISNHRPVGIMIFGSAELQGAPWDLVIKDFRENLGDKSFDKLSEYAHNFFDFIQEHKQIFSSDYREKLFVTEADKIVAIYLLRFAPRDEKIKTAKTNEERKNAYNQFLQSVEKKIENTPLSKHFNEEDLDNALEKFKPQLIPEVQATIKFAEIGKFVDAGRMAELGIRSLMKKFANFMSGTGVVFAGFGEQEYFPSFIEYNCYGILLNKLVYDHEKEQVIDITRQSDVEPFAKSDMVHTFMMGFSPDIYAYVNEAFEKGLDELVDLIKSGNRLRTVKNKKEHIKKVSEAFKDKWLGSALEAHYTPLARVVGSLPLGEMAELAETLIMLESLKEKVTTPTETVGGPIDVAVISKGDGFVWIKRKHYFDSSLNPRFFLRQRARLKS